MGPPPADPTKHHKTFFCNVAQKNKRQTFCNEKNYNATSLQLFVNRRMSFVLMRAL